MPIETENEQLSPVLPEPRTEREAIEFQPWPIFVKEVGEEHKPKPAEIQDGQAFSRLTKPLTEKLTDGGDFDNQYPLQAFLKQYSEKYKSLPWELQGEMERKIEREVYDEKLTNDLDDLLRCKCGRNAN